MKILDPQIAGRLLYPHPVLLLTAGAHEKYNITTISWYAVLSQNPPLIGIALTPSSFSYPLIRESGEFNLHIPTLEILNKVHYCGVTSGHDTDKILEMNFLAIPGRMNRNIWLTECVGHLECMFVGNYKMGDHVWVVGEIILGAVEEVAFEDGFWDPDVELLQHYGGFKYVCKGQTHIAKEEKITIPAFMDTRTVEEMRRLRSNNPQPLFPPPDRK